MNSSDEQSISDIRSPGSAFPITAASIVVLVVGASRTGKSKCIHAVDARNRRNQLPLVVAGGRSSRAPIDIFKVGNYHFIDTLGFGDSNGNSNHSIRKAILQFLQENATYEGRVQIHAILWFTPGGIAQFDRYPEACFIQDLTGGKWEKVIVLQSGPEFGGALDAVDAVAPRMARPPITRPTCRVIHYPGAPERPLPSYLSSNDLVMSSNSTANLAQLVQQLPRISTPINISIRHQKCQNCQQVGIASTFAPLCHRVNLSDRHHLDDPFQLHLGRVNPKKHRYVYQPIVDATSSAAIALCDAFTPNPQTGVTVQQGAAVAATAGTTGMIAKVSEETKRTVVNSVGGALWGWTGALGGAAAVGGGLALFATDRCSDCGAHRTSSDPPCQHGWTCCTRRSVDNKITSNGCTAVCRSCRQPTTEPGCMINCRNRDPQQGREPDAPRCDVDPYKFNSPSTAFGLSGCTEIEVGHVLVDA